MFFQISPVRAKPKSEQIAKPKNDSEEIEILSLAPFTPLPKLFFENIKIGELACRKLLIKNPTTQDIIIHVKLNNIPLELSVSVSWETKCLEKGGEEMFEICWCPPAEVSNRYTITFEDLKKIHREVPIVFKTYKTENKKSTVKSAKPKVASYKVKKNYTTKSSKISPNKFKSPVKHPPCKKGMIPELIVTYPNITDISGNKQHLRSDKENVPFMLNQSNTSNGFVSPKNFSFRLDNINGIERRETYVLNNGGPKPTSFNLAERRETYTLSKKAIDVSPKQFNDSLESIDPVTSPTFALAPLSTSDRTPLKMYNYVNIPSRSDLNQSKRNDLLSDFEYKMRHFQSFCFSPANVSRCDSNALFKEDIGKSTLDSSDFALMADNKFELPEDDNTETSERPNISSGTYVKDNSFETYIKGNLSSETYTKEVSHNETDKLNISPFPSNLSVSPTFLHPDNGISQKSCEYRIETRRKQLSCIVEESYMSNSFRNSTPNPNINRKSILKRKSDIDYIFSPPKKPNIPTGVKNWSKKGGCAVRVAKETSGLNVSRLHSKANEDVNKEGIVELAKSDENKIIIKNPFLLAATNALDPFMLPHLAVNEEWVEKQENNFKKWLNALLTPPKDLTSEERTIDVAKIWQQSKKSEVEVAPSKEFLSNQYHTSNRLNNLRKAARELYQSQNIGLVLSKVYAAVEKGKLSIREDRDVRSNLALRAEITSLLLSYNPLWLRIGLETIYNEIIPLNSNSDVIGLSHFIANRLLKDPYLLKKYKSVLVPNYVKDFNKFFLKKYFTLVYFLDIAKGNKLIAHDPCLFCKKAVVKESKELLVGITREILSSIGDVTKFLKYYGYIVTHVQTYIHEFDYGVKKLGVDLRDGVRLTKVMEIILLRNDLVSALRVPAISRLQKIHNMKIVFDSLEQGGYQLMYDICPKDIVDGHREKTLSFLWQLIYKFETPFIIKSATTIQTWYKSLPVVLKRKMLERKRLLRECSATKIQNWYRTHKLSERLIFFAKSLKFYLEYIKKEQAATKIQSYYKMYIWRKAYSQQKQLIIKIQSRCRGWLMRNVNGHKYRSAVTLQSYIRMFIQRRKYLKLRKAVVLIQRRYRAQLLMKNLRTNYLSLKYATNLIQTKFRANRLALREKHIYKELKTSTIRVQQMYRANKMCRLQRKQYLTLKSAAIMIQSWYRAKKARRLFISLKQSVECIEKHYLAVKFMKIQRHNYQSLRSATLTIQCRYRALKEMRIQRGYYVKLKTSIVFIQQKYRAKKYMEIEHIYYEKLKHAAIFVQRQFRAKLLMRDPRKDFVKAKMAACIIQNWFRASVEMKKCRTYYLSLKFAVQIVEQKYEAIKLMEKERESFKLKKRSAIIIQRRYRALILMRYHTEQYNLLRQSCILIQNRYRANRLSKMQRLQFLQLQAASITIQKRFRAQLRMLECRQRFQKLKSATTLLQSKFRANLLMKQQRNYYECLRKYVIIVQRQFRARQSMLYLRNKYDNLKTSTVLIQRRWRARKLCVTQKNDFIHMKETVIFIQRRWRANKHRDQDRTNYITLQKSTLFIQRTWRASILRKKYLDLKRATIIIQQRWRARHLCITQRRDFIQLKYNTIFVQQIWRANKLRNNDKNNYVTLKKTAVLIQRIWRAKILRNKSLVYYHSLRKSVILIQQKWRAKQIGKIETKYYEDLKKATILIQQKWRGNKLACNERTKYIEIRTAIIVIQRRWKAKLIYVKVRSDYMKLRAAAIIIERRWRAKKIGQSQKKSYEKLRSMVICIQRRWRATKLCVQERDNYCILRNAVMCIQSRWKANKKSVEARSNYLKLLQTTIKIQQKWRAIKACRLQQKKYQDLRTAAVVIQQKWIANQHCLRQKKEYELLKNTTLFIQRKWRANKLRSRDFNSYATLKKAAEIVQQRWRAKKMHYEQKCYYQSLRNSVIIIQRKWRANKLMNSDRNNYLSIKRSIVTIQTRWRAIKVRKEYMQMKRVVINLQQKWRAKQLMISERQSFVILKYTTIFVQRTFRANTLRKKNRAFYLSIRRSVITIQRFYRGYREMKQLQSKFVVLRRSTLKLQAFARGYLVRRQYGEFFSEEARNQRQIERKQKTAAIKIQAMWKGFQCRKSLIPECDQIYQRLKKANQAADPVKTLASRAKAALRTLTCARTTLFSILKALEELEYTIRHSEEIAEMMAKLLPNQLYIMLCATSRSLPEMNACILSVNILITFCKYPSTKMSSFVPGYIDPLVTVMLHWCDKESVLFPLICTLFWLFAHEAKWKNFILSLPNFNQRFDKIRSLVIRKENMVRKAGVKGSSLFSSHKSLPTPGLKPNFGLTYNVSRPNTFNNSVQAMLELSKILNI